LLQVLQALGPSDDECEVDGVEDVEDPVDNIDLNRLVHINHKQQHAVNDKSFDNSLDTSKIV